VTEQSLWGASVAGWTVSTDVPSQPLMLGLRFDVTCAGRLAGFRHLQHPQYSGLTLAFLWFENGQLERCESMAIEALAPGGSTPVWRQEWIHPRQRLLVNTSYVLGVFLNRDQFIYRPGAYLTAHSVGCITALAHSNALPNGLFGYSPILSMPLSDGGGTAYGLDLLFQPD
jgi:Domain of unknown function (DUF4082)